MWWERLFEAKGERSDALQFFADGGFTSLLILRNASGSSLASLVRAVILPPPGWRRWAPGFAEPSCDLEAGDCIGGRVLVKAEGMVGRTDPLRKTLQARRRHLPVSLSASASRCCPLQLPREGQGCWFGELFAAPCLAFARTPVSDLPPASAPF
ncbi:hypothetical protein EVAR_25541_1 [Eumeta japonica]|uniref:Uncharacterized protein n=1 Tax=Eumeta variegata TaxID=151549 RepID=A0A4C1VN00_EUMVA|nr:hypothetical protein EVAR_25541_1 [Eumeta japonica]